MLAEKHIFALRLKDLSITRKNTASTFQKSVKWNLL